MKVCSCSPQRHNNSILSFLAPPYRHSLGQGRCWISYPGKSAAAGLSCSLPYHRHYSPPPIKLPLTALYRHAVEQVCDRRRNKWHWTGWLLARAGYVSPCCKSCVYGICPFVLRCFFFCSHTVLPMEHSLGVNFFFSSLSSCKCCIFLPFPVFLFCLPRCQMYVVYVWTG